TSDNDGKALRPSVRAPASVTRFPGSVSGACGAGSRSPRPPPFAPSPPLPVARCCSATSSLLWRGLTSHARASSASAPRLPDAGQRLFSLWSSVRSLRFRRIPFRRDVDLLRKSGEFPMRYEELDDTAATVYEGI